MSATTVFRALILGALAFAVSATAVDFIPGVIPDRLLAAVDAELQSQLSPGALFPQLIASVLVGVLWLVSAAGQFAFARWARPLALAVTVVNVALDPLLPATVHSGWASSAMHVSHLAWGAVLAMAYWSPVRLRFADGRRRIVTAPTHDGTAPDR